jgi:tetratricopeptide (TPR) repeat protein
MKRLIFLAGLALVTPTASFADSNANLDTCSDESAVPWERIQSCTEIISNGAAAKGEALRNRGSVYADAEKFDLAIADETAAIGLNPRDAIAYNLRAWAYLESGKTEKALLITQLRQPDRRYRTNQEQTDLQRGFPWRATKFNSRKA